MIMSVKSVTYRRKGAQHFDPILSCERVRRVHAAKVGEAGGRVCRSPTQDVAELRRVCVDGVPRHQELGGGGMMNQVTKNPGDTFFSAFYSRSRDKKKPFHGRAI